MSRTQPLRYFNPRLSDDLDFMPYLAGALTQDASRTSRVTVWVIGALIVTAMVWAKFAVLEEVTTGEGKAIPSSKVQVIQNLEGGIVTEIFVHEGQMVNKGEALLQLDDTPFRSNQRRLASEQRTLNEQLRQKTQIKSKVQKSEFAFRSDASRELTEKRSDLSRISANSIAIDDRVTHTTVVSPVHGIVKMLKVNTIGGVVQPGTDLVEIVPLEDNLLIEAKVRPQDVAFLHPGQKAMVKFSAYDYTIYGSLPARLELIGADTITDDKGNSFYLIQVRTDRNQLGTDNKPLLIIPGMIATVDIITGEKSVMDYLLKPVLKARTEALRER